jgi:hypothetical protein
MSDAESFEEQNLINLILYHKSKLRKIQKGVSAGKLFTIDERKKLRKYEILTYLKLTWGLSEKAKKILQKD